MKIKSVIAQEVLDSRGNPTVQADVILDTGAVGSAKVPSGASTGQYEALELRDGDDKRYLGKGVTKAVVNVNTEIAAALQGMDPTAQQEIDKKMCDSDGTPTKSRLGANAILAVSMAVTQAAAAGAQKPLYQYVAELFGQPTDHYTLPIPMMNLLNGGKHAINSADMQEFMVMPVGATSVAEAVRFGSEIFHHLGKFIKSKGWSTTVGDEGGYAPPFDSNAAPLDAIMQAITAAGYEPGKQVAIAMDPATSELYENGSYNLKRDGKVLSTAQMLAWYQEMVGKYPIISIEDGLAEDDWAGFTAMTQLMGDKVQLVGDDLFVTNTERLARGIKEKAGNAILIKLNQIGTVSETMAAMNMAKAAGFESIVSHRSGETEDTFIADFVVGAGAGQIKTGSLSRTDRVAKYNRLMNIERELGDKAQYAQFPK